MVAEVADLSGAPMQGESWGNAAWGDLRLRRIGVWVVQKLCVFLLAAAVIGLTSVAALSRAASAEPASNTIGAADDCGAILCGVASTTPGLSVPNGLTRRGLDPDHCRALATAGL